MIPLAEAQRRVRSRPWRDPGSEVVPVEQALGRVLSAAPSSDQDLPPFDRVTMDGYAVIADDIRRGSSHRCIGEVAAGATALRPLQRGEVYRVMTGAPLPSGADAVIRQEDAIEESDGVRFQGTVSAGANIHARGTDLRQGAAPLKSGDRIFPASVPLLLTLGCRFVSVYRRPTVAIITSGDELVAPEQVPSPSKIRDSNRLSLAAQTLTAGGLPTCLPIVPDDRHRLHEAFATTRGMDLILLVGGSSAGKFDYSRTVVSESGAHLWFDQVAIQPGKPVQYFTTEGQQIFCLPGNPVSAFVTFELLVRPVIERFQGLRAVDPVPLRMRCTRAAKAPAQRDLFLVARISAGSAIPGEWTVEPIRWSGSGDLVSLSRANGLVRVAMGGEALVGSTVDVFLLPSAAVDLPRFEDRSP